MCDGVSHLVIYQASLWCDDQLGGGRIETTMVLIGVLVRLDEKTSTCWASQQHQLCCAGWHDGRFVSVLLRHPSSHCNAMHWPPFTCFLDQIHIRWFSLSEILRE